MKPIQLIACVALLLGIDLQRAGAARAAEPSVATAAPFGHLPLTEAEVVALAVRDAPSVMAAQHDAAAADAAHTAAERARLPDVAVSARATRLSSIPARYRTLPLPSADGVRTNVTIPQVLDSWGARANVVVPLSDTWLALAANARALGQLAAAKDLEIQATRATVAYEARAAFLIYRRAQVARRVSESALRALEAQVREQDQRVQAGTAPGSSSLTFYAARDGAFARLRRAESEVAASEAAVRSFLPAALADVPLGIEGSARPTFARGSIEAAAVLRAAEAAVRAADTRADAQRLAMLPHLNLVGGIELSAPNPRAFAVDSAEVVPSWDISLTLDWSLSSLTTGSALHDQALAEREALRARVEGIRRTLIRERQAAVAARSSAEARVSAALLGVTTATRLAQARRNELVVGMATPLDVTNAESELVRAELEAADAELDLRLAEAQLAYAEGHVPPAATNAFR
jgi:outer membrane protein TolC